MRRRYIQMSDGQLIEVSRDHEADPRTSGVLICADLPGYQSPVTGLWVEGRAQRREDLKRTASRPYEGREQELKEAARHDAYRDQKIDASLTRAASEAYYQLPPSKRAILKGTS